MSFRHELRIRYGECDMQQVVFNAHYLAYIDDAVDTWLRTALGSFEAGGFDCMVKKVEIEWHRAARFGEVLALELGVARWGRTSFDITVAGTVGPEAVFSSRSVYISTTPGAAVATPVPAWVREALGEASDPPS